MLLFQGREFGLGNYSIQFDFHETNDKDQIKLDGASLLTTFVLQDLEWVHQM